MIIINGQEITGFVTEEDWEDDEEYYVVSQFVEGFIDVERLNKDISAHLMIVRAKLAFHKLEDAKKMAKALFGYLSKPPTCGGFLLERRMEQRREIHVIYGDIYRKKQDLKSFIRHQQINPELEDATINTVDEIYMLFEEFVESLYEEVGQSHSVLFRLLENIESLTND